jgi:hypothetical protein
MPVPGRRQPELRPKALATPSDTIIDKTIPADNPIYGIKSEKNIKSPSQLGLVPPVF